MKSCWEKKKLIMSGSGGNGRNGTQSMSGGTGLREERAPSSPVRQRRENSLEVWGLKVVGSSILMASICFFEAGSKV